MFGLFRKTPVPVTEFVPETKQTSEQKQINFNPDRPIHRDEEDRLGFSRIAENLATSVISSGTEDGLVIGIQGGWGSGKSSILNLLCNHVEKKHAAASVIRFEPWVIGDRDNMVSTLLANIAREVDKLERAAGETAKHRLEDTVSLSNTMRQYAASASRGLSPVAKLASIFGVPYASVAEKGLESLASIAPSKKATSLPEIKDKLVDGLRKLNHRFVVVIDDIDRLEPAEAAEVIRLVRAVGDFPNIIYILCYEKNVLAKSLEAALKVENGAAFLQKIIQVSFDVPRPEEFDLRRWISKDCRELYKTVTEIEIPDDIGERLKQACDAQGGNLQTPRDIGLILNALRLFYPPVVGRVDFADLCWLQIIRVRNEGLYKWIENYLGIYAALQDGASLRGAAKKRMTNELYEHLGISIKENEERENDEDIEYFRAFLELRDYLPGIEARSSRDDGGKIFNNVPSSKLAEFEAGHRLGSPQHYRLYFAFSQPAGALNDDEFDAILTKAANGQPIQADLEGLIQRIRPQGGTMYEIFLDRLRRHGFRDMPAAAIIDIIYAIADTIDDGHAAEPEPQFFGVQTVYRDGREILKTALEKLGSTRREDFLKQLFQDRKALGWLLGEVIGDEIFNHGRVDNSNRSQRTFLTKSELDEAINSIFKRLSGADRIQIIAVPNSLSFFYRWKQAGGAEDQKKWMDDLSQTDEGFLTLLEKCRSWSASDRVYHPLNKREVEYFMNVDETLNRLERIQSDKKKPLLKQRADELFNAIRIGDWPSEIKKKFNIEEEAY